MWIDMTKIGLSLCMTGCHILPNINYFREYKKYWNGEKILVYKIIESTSAILIISSLYI
jgi:hypothetical protein